MPVYITLPAAVGSQNNWTLGAGATKQAAVRTSDDATSYIISGAGVLQTFTVDPILPPLVTVALVEIGGRGSLVTHYSPGLNEAINGVVRLSGTNTITTGDNGTNTWAYRNWGPVTAARPGGGSWAPVDLTTVEVGVQGCQSSGASQYNLTYVYLQVTGSPVSGGYIAMVAGLVGAAIGLSEMAGLAREVFKRTRVRILPEEYEAAWRELRYDPRRRIFA